MGKNKTSSMQRTLKYLRKNGYTPWIAETFNPYAGKFGQREDMFTIFDIIAYGHGNIIGVQACGSDFAPHDKKILNCVHSAGWIKNGGCIQLYGWRKVKAKRGGKLMIWKPRIKEYKFYDFKDLIDRKVKG